MASVRKLPDGRWQAQYRPFPGGKQITRTTRKKSDAQRWLDEQTTSLVSGNYVDPHAGRVTFGAYFERWSARQIWVPGTARAMTLAARSVPFWDVPLQRLLRSHIELWIKEMQTANRGPDRAAGLAPGTIRTRVNNVRAVLRGAVKDRVLATDPSEGVKLPRARRTDVAMELPTSDDVRVLLEMADRRFVCFIALCAFAGLRLGEAAAVQVGDFDLAARRLVVRRQVQRANNQAVEIRAPKYGSERTVHLADGLVDIVRVHLAGLSGRGSERWLFRGENGNPPHQNTVGYWWRKTRRDAGHQTIRLHDLRHFFASGLIAAGCDVVTVQRALGHSSATVTLSTYAHLWPTAEDRTRAAADSMLTAVLGATDEPVTNTPEP
ncbi:site-specific integrase [Pseudonocardia sp. NPDC046786]|uniref:tyrosine-type recombinase/integrase n=1 Tax=Pseudonocardia sp. NPDC046786 TaxID=3155471 RepID=UPI0033E3B2AD